MLLMPNKKKMATLIVGGAKPDYVQKMGEKGYDKDMDMSEADDDEDQSMGLEAAAEKITSSIERGDAAALSSALKDFIEMCSHNSEGDY